VVPAVEAVLAQRKAAVGVEHGRILARFADRVAAGEVVVDVFFGVRYVPQGVFAGRAIRESAEHARARGIGVGTHERVTARGPMNIHRRARGDAAVLARAEIARPAVSIAMDLHDRDAVRRLHERDCVRMLLQPRLAASGFMDVPRCPGKISSPLTYS
jgi:hypothetical protein